MKKIICLMLSVVMIFLMAGCGEDPYPPVKSTDEEARLMMTMSYGDETYEVRYELYRALFLNYSSEYDGGDKSFWSKPESEDELAKINQKIISFAADIYAALHVARSIGFDPYSAEADELVYEYIEASVNGTEREDGSYVGYGGDYDAYLASLKAMNLNYSVQDLLYRYAICTDKINEYYAGTVDSSNPTPDMQSGALTVTDELISSFYEGDDSARVLIITLDARSFSEKRAGEIRDKIASFADVQSVVNYALGFTTTTEADVKRGVLIGKHSLDGAYYSELTDEAFGLEVGEASGAIMVSTDTSSNYYILYKVEKTDEYYADNRDDVKDVYIKNAIGKIIFDVKGALISSSLTSELYTSIDHSAIKMD